MIAALLLAALLPAAQPAPVPSTTARPADAVAAERAFRARAMSDGQWAAYRATAAPGAIMLAPHPIAARDALAKMDGDPAVAAMWSPARVWTSCDGSLAVTTGPWVRKGGAPAGTFTNVWRREADGSWRWVYANSRETPRAVDAPDEPLVFRPGCPASAPRVAPAGEQGLWLQRDGRMPGEWGIPFQPAPSKAAAASGRSADGSMGWEVHRQPDGGANAYIFQVWQRGASPAPDVPQAAGQPAGPAVVQHLVVVEAHGFDEAPR